MNGTLDLLDTFFGTITGVCGRVVSFFLTCWAGFALGVVAQGVRWTFADGFSSYFTINDWYLAPISWGFLSAATCLHWWGCIHFLMLIVIAFRIFFSEMNLCQAVCSLLIIESWYWWFVANHLDFDLQEYWDYWHPVMSGMVLFSVFLAWLWWRSWQNNHPANP